MNEETNNEKLAEHVNSQLNLIYDADRALDEGESNFVRAFGVWFEVHRVSINLDPTELEFTIECSAVPSANMYKFPMSREFALNLSSKLAELIKEIYGVGEDEDTNF
jgi:hypothetical protein